MGPGSAWEDLRAKLPAAVLHAGGMETKSSRTNPEGLNPEAGRDPTWSQVATWSAAPRPAQAPPPPRPSACRPRPLPPEAGVAALFA